MRLRTMTAGLALAIASAALARAQAPAPGSPAPAVASGANAAQGPAPTTYIVRFKVKPGRNADFERVMRKVQLALPTSEPGNVYYDLYRPAPDSQIYIIIEHYRNAAAIAAHGQDPAVREMATAIQDLIDGRPEAEQLILVSSKP